MKVAISADTLILQLGVILNTVPAWKRAYKLRVAVFVEYESDVEEERGRVKSLLEKLRIEAEVLVFWLASGNLSTYEIVVNGGAASEEEEAKVEECLNGQDWWDEIQRYRGKRGQIPAASEDLANIFTSGTNWPEATYQQGNFDGKVQRFSGIRKLLNTKRRHSVSDISKLGVNLNMRTQRLPATLLGQHSGNVSASEDSGSSDESDGSDSEAIDENESDGPSSVVSEADIDEYELENDRDLRSQTSRQMGDKRRSLSDTMGSMPVFKRSSSRRRENRGEGQSQGPSLEASPRPSLETASGSATPQGLLRSNPERPTSSASNGSAPMSPVRPSLARHSSQPKFTSKPVPITRVATEDGPGPSIMFADTPSPPTRRHPRLPSAYQNKASLASDINEEAEENDSSSHRGSSYSTQALPLSFNDLPCRAQHLILNELMQRESADTAVLFTTLPSPTQGTCESAEASMNYLSDLEVLCKDCPPMLMVHSNSMTVTISL